MNDFLLQPPRSKHYYHRGKKYALGRAGRRTLQLLREIGFSPECHSTTGLLMIRPRIRDALAYPRPVLLTLLIDTSPNTRVLRIAIWMLGRIGDPYATRSVARHVDHESFAVRREAIRALHRLHAWTQLRRIEREHRDPKIRAIAKPAAPKNYADRLSQFIRPAASPGRAASIQRTASIERVASTERVGPDRRLVIDAEVDFGAGRQPKSGWRIASVLRRIHRLVRRSRRRRKSFTLTMGRLCRRSR